MARGTGVAYGAASGRRSARELSRRREGVGASLAELVQPEPSRRTARARLRWDRRACRLPPPRTVGVDSIWGPQATRAVSVVTKLPAIFRRRPGHFPSGASSCLTDRESPSASGAVTPRCRPGFRAEASSATSLEDEAVVVERTQRNEPGAAASRRANAGKRSAKGMKSTSGSPSAGAESRSIAWRAPCGTSHQRAHEPPAV